MKIPRLFYLVAAIIGTIVPWYFFAVFFMNNGFDIPLFISSLFANGAAAGFVMDVLISLVVFWVWSFADAKTNNVKHWWLVLPASFLVGLSLAFPMYLYMRTED